MILFFGGISTYCLNLSLVLLAPVLILTVNQRFLFAESFQLMCPHRDSAPFFHYISVFISTDFRLLKYLENNVKRLTCKHLNHPSFNWLMYSIA